MSIKENVDDKAARAAFVKFKSHLQKAARTDSRLTPSARALAAAVLDRIYSATGYCGASVAELQAEIGARSRRTVQQALGALLDAGYFVADRSSGRRTNRIYLADEIPANRAKSAGSNRAKSAGSNRAKSAGDPAAECAVTAHVRAP
jgi:hypothetical protein